MNLYKIIVMSFLFTTSLQADRITIHNRTPQDLYVAAYYSPVPIPLKEQANAMLGSTIAWIESNKSAPLERPEFKWMHNRYLVFTDDKELLTPELVPNDSLLKNAKDIGALTGDVFYIGDKQGLFFGVSLSVWTAIQNALENTKQKIISTLPAITQNPHKNDVAQVRQGNSLAPEELAYVQARAPKVKSALEKFLNSSLAGKKTPTIAIASSGGGYRAMLYALGALLGAQEIGLLDATTYVVGASGSTWAISGWLLSGQSLEQYNEWLVNNIHFGLKNISTSDLKLMSDHLLTRYFSDEPLDIVDIYGALLANELLAQHGPLKQRLTLSGQARALANATAPFPIYTAISVETPDSEGLWYEFTPYEVGAAWMGNGMYVPSWAFGRKFNNGTSVNFAPEQNFGVLMATFGLAPAATISRLIQEIDLKNKAPFSITKNIIDRIVQEFGHKRLTTSGFNNFSYGMPASIYNNLPTIRLGDAGINFNLPYPPVSGQRPERAADVIIFMDASADNLTRELQDVEKYARLHNLKFPKINYAGIEKQVVSVFKDEYDTQAPVVIYIPRIREKDCLERAKSSPTFKNLGKTLAEFDIEECIKAGTCSTFNFNCPLQDARAMSALGEYNIKTAKDAIVDAIRWKVNTEERRVGKKLFQLQIQ